MLIVKVSLHKWWWRLIKWISSSLCHLITLSREMTKWENGNNGTHMRSHPLIPCRNFRSCSCFQKVINVEKRINSFPKAVWFFRNYFWILFLIPQGTSISNITWVFGKGLYGQVDNYSGDLLVAGALLTHSSIQRNIQSPWLDRVNLSSAWRFEVSQSYYISQELNPCVIDFPSSFGYIICTCLISREGVIMPAIFLAGLLTTRGREWV